jgi:hypothetical protein
VARGVGAPVRHPAQGADTGLPAIVLSSATNLLLIRRAVWPKITPDLQITIGVTIGRAGEDALTEEQYKEIQITYPFD